MMQRHNYRLMVLGCSIIWLLAACGSPKYFVHAPTPVNNPFLKEKNDIQLTANVLLGEGIATPGLDFQSAYAISDHLAFTASFSKRPERNKYKEHDNIFSQSPDSAGLRYMRNNAEFAVGYFTPINTAKTVYFNMYGGWGFGKNIFTQNKKQEQAAPKEDVYRIPLQKWFIQPSLNFMMGEHFRMGVALKASWLQFQTPATSFTEQDLLDIGFSRYSQRTIFLAEPATSMQFVPENSPVSFNININLLALPADDDDHIMRSNVYFRRINLALGVMLHVGQLFKK
ncbi:hypothetical protein ACFS6H_08575 [Terrimonas rubra]|uniref:Outer membrane protein beta-barrel domain-containing protein n=1 Tax=Terrimonas rubra TaxID=1035890 RepID=A0ABW6A6J0_9BACT